MELFDENDKSLGNIRKRVLELRKRLYDAGLIEHRILFVLPMIEPDEDFLHENIFLLEKTIR